MISGEGGGGEYRISEEMRAALAPSMRALGLPMPGEENRVPKVNIDTPPRELAMLCGQLLRRSGLYRLAPSEMLITFENGKIKPMTSVMFCTFIERSVSVVKTYKGQKGAEYDCAVGMGKDLAAKILEAWEFRSEIPLIKDVVKVRVPVLRKSGVVELCAAGYDEECGLFCHDEVRFDNSMAPGDAMKLLGDWHSEFMWGDYTPGADLWKNRSFLAHMTGMIGYFARQLLPAGVPRPPFLYVANEQGSGKSNLVSMVLSAIHGDPVSADLPTVKGGLNPEKFTALLETVAQSMKPFLWLDDVPDSVFSNSLNRFTTARAHTGRKYGGNADMFEVLNVTQVFMTGNNVHTTRDLMQRFLVVELFMSVDSTSRTKFKRHISPEWLGEPEQRATILAALWALVKAWVAEGMIEGDHVQARFRSWSVMVGGVLKACGVEQNPFVIPDLPLAGDEETDDMKALLKAFGDDAEELWDNTAGDESWPGFEVDMEKIVAKARTMGILMDIVGGSDKPLDKGDLKKLGKRLGKWRGREDLATTKGRRFKFGSRKQERKHTYPLTWLA